MRPVPKFRPDVVTEKRHPMCWNCSCGGRWTKPTWCGGCGHERCSFEGVGGQAYRICNEADCEGAHYALGMCKTHWFGYDRYRKRLARRKSQRAAA